MLAELCKNESSPGLTGRFEKASLNGLAVIGNRGLQAGCGFVVDGNSAGALAAVRLALLSWSPPTALAYVQLDTNGRCALGISLCTNAW